MPGLPQILEPPPATIVSPAKRGGTWNFNECLSAEERETTELAEPNGRCAECIADRGQAMNRILELARMETGQCGLLLEYLGYSSYELDKPFCSIVMDHVGRGVRGSLPAS